MMKTAGQAVCVLMFISLISSCATRQDISDMDSRMQALDQSMVTLSSGQEDNGKRMELMEERLTSQEQDLRSSYARMNSEMDGLRVSVQKLQGNMEESDFRVRSGKGGDPQGLKNELVILKDEIHKLSARLQHLSDYVGLESTPVVAPEKNPAPVKKQESSPVSNTKSSDPQALYVEAKQAFDNGSLERAREGFEEILKRFPKSERAGNAQFWLGEIYYKENWFEKAILEYQKVIDGYPKGNKVASALLKQGFAFEKLGQKANARLILEDLVRRFPGASETLIAQRKLRQL